jgi:hypothetical protein
MDFYGQNQLSQTYQLTNVNNSLQNSKKLDGTENTTETFSVIWSQYYNNRSVNLLIGQGKNSVGKRKTIKIKHSPMICWQSPPSCYLYGSHEKAASTN